MERGSSKHGPMVDEAMQRESEAVERSGKDPRAEEAREKEGGAGHRRSGSGTSTDEYPHKDHGETGGENHPRPEDAPED